MNQTSYRNGSVLQPVENLLQIARKVQEALIPRRLPVIDGLSIGSFFCPGSQPGGTCFEVVRLSEEKLVLLMYSIEADPLEAAFISLFARNGFIKNLSAWRSPSGAIDHVYSEITREITQNFSLAAFVGYLDLAESILSWCNTGLPGAMLWRQESGSWLALEAQPIPGSGYVPGNLREQAIHLGPGDWLFLHTAGMKNLCDESDDNSERLLHSVKEESQSPDRFVEKVRARYKEFTQARQEYEDLSLIVLEAMAESRSDLLKKSLGFEPGAAVRFRTLRSFEEMDGVVGAVLRAMDLSGFPDETIRKMKISLIELIANAIVHGNGKSPEKHVVLGFSVNSRKAVISIMDEGEGFNPQSIPDPTLPENIGKDCGRGLYLVRHFVDLLEFNDIGNRITITKFHSVELEQ